MSTGPAHREPLLGEWACLGILVEEPAHGWAVAARLRPTGDIGRVWQLSRPLTYRSLDHLTWREWAEPVAEEPGDAGPNRTILAPTVDGRTQFRTWLRTPVEHQRDLRSELLLKLVFAERLGVDLGELLDRQREIVDRHADVQTRASDADPADVVALWRLESTLAARRFLDRIAGRRPTIRDRIGTDRDTDRVET